MSGDPSIVVGAKAPDASPSSEVSSSESTLATSHKGCDGPGKLHIDQQHHHAADVPDADVPGCSPEITSKLQSAPSGAVANSISPDPFILLYPLPVPGSGDDIAGLSARVKSIVAEMHRQHQSSHGAHRSENAPGSPNVIVIQLMPAATTTPVEVGNSPTNPGEHHGWFTVADAVKFVDLSKPTISRLCSQRKVRSIGTGASRRVDMNSLIAYKRKSDLAKLQASEVSFPR